MERRPPSRRLHVLAAAAAAAATAAACLLFGVIDTAQQLSFSPLKSSSLVPPCTISLQPHFMDIYLGCYERSVLVLPRHSF
jgi:hypothetical protein